jgi:hypothetical protein
MSTRGNIAAAYDRRRRREQQLVHLQYVGDMPGTPAGQLEIGDRFITEPCREGTHDCRFSGCKCPGHHRARARDLLHAAPGARQG